MQRPRGREEAHGSEEHEGRGQCSGVGSAGPREGATVLPGAPGLHSRALDELLQVLDLAAQLLGRREAPAHLHEQSCDLVAAQEAGCPPPQPVQDTGLHRRCGDMAVSRPHPVHAPALSVAQSTHQREAAWTGGAPEPPHSGQRHGKTSCDLHLLHLRRWLTWSRPEMDRVCSHPLPATGPCVTMGSDFPALCLSFLVCKGGTVSVATL